LGKLAYWNRQAPGPNAGKVDADRPKLVLLASLLGMFVLDGLVGAFGFKYWGFGVTVPLAGFLVLLAGVPLFDDISARRSGRSS
jgi:hypothetical protein